MKTKHILVPVLLSLFLVACGGSSSVKSIETSKPAELSKAKTLLAFIEIQLSMKKTVNQKAIKATKALNVFIQKGFVFLVNSVKIVLE